VCARMQPRGYSACAARPLQPPPTRASPGDATTSAQEASRILALGNTLYHYHAPHHDELQVTIKG
jgi:hypothetical protein